MKEAWKEGETPSWIAVGVSCAALRINDEARGNKDSLILPDLRVTRIGKKYFEVAEAGNLDRALGKFHLSNGLEKVSVGARRFQLFPSEQHVKDHLAYKKKLQEIYNSLTQFPRMELTDQQIHDIIFQQGT
jgi:hypothetical protein